MSVIFLLALDKIVTYKVTFTFLTIETLERRQWGHSGVFIVKFENISHLLVVLLLFTFNK